MEKCRGERLGRMACLWRYFCASHGLAVTNIKFGHQCTWYRTTLGLQLMIQLCSTESHICSCMSWTLGEERTRAVNWSPAEGGVESEGKERWLERPDKLKCVVMANCSLGEGPVCVMFNFHPQKKHPRSLLVPAMVTVWETNGGHQWGRRLFGLLTQASPEAANRYRQAKSAAATMVAVWLPRQGNQAWPRLGFSVDE